MSFSNDPPESDPASASVAASGNQGIDGLLYGAKWSVNALTFSFPTQSSDYGTNYGNYNEHVNGFQAFDTGQQEAVRGFLKSIASMTGLTFTESSGGDGIMRFAESNTPTDRSSAAYAYYPTANNPGGDVWTNHTDYEANLMKPGSFGWRSLQHEIGHALGLKHGHSTGGPANQSLPSQYDGHEFSVMTYNSYIGDVAGNGYENEPSGHPQSLMMMDIAALQYMYGANYGATANNTATTYRFDAATGQMFINNAGQEMPFDNRVFRTIWDGGGIDTYDFSNYGDGMSVDLAPGAWSTFSVTQLADLGGGANGGFARANLFNALLYGNNTASLIENAIGGAGADTLYGNQAANRLDGRGGADTMGGRDGNDTYIVDNGNDVIVENEDEGRLDVVITSVTYTLSADAEVERFTTNSASGTDPTRLTGNDFAQTIIGNAGDNWLDGRGGFDTMSGGLGDDRYFVDSARDRVSEAIGGGDDYVVTSVTYALRKGAEIERLATTSFSSTNTINLTGNEFGQKIFGNDGANKIYGKDGLDQLFGYGGRDLIYGGLGADKVTGGLGDDLFMFDTPLGGDNIDTILDFHNVVGDNDTIRMDNKYFTMLAKTGALKSDFFAANATGTAVDGDDYIVYNTTTGELFYDSNGNLAGGVVKFAVLTGAPTLTSSDFLVF
jgi:serralysin